MRRRTATLVVIASAMAATVIPSPASALTPGEVAARIDKVRASLRSLDGRLSDAERDLDRAETAITRHRASLRRANTQRAALRQAMNRQAFQLYVLGGNTLEVLGSTDTLASMVDRFGYLEQIRAGERGMLEEIRALQKRASWETSLLRREEAEASRIRASLSGRVREMRAKLQELSQLQAFLNSVARRPGLRGSRSRRGFVCPVGGPSIVSNNFGDRRPGGPHQGNDIRADHGQPVRSVGPARVVETPTGSWWGIGIVTRDPAGTEWWYAHMSARYVRVGDTVAPGELIGRVGCTGTCYGDHLHFEWHPGGGNARDPYRLLTAAC